MTFDVEVKEQTKNLYRRLTGLISALFFRVSTNIVLDLCGTMTGGSGLIGRSADFGGLLLADPVRCSPLRDSTLEAGVDLILMLGTIDKDQTLVKKTSRFSPGLRFPPTGDTRLSTSEWSVQKLT